MASSAGENNIPILLVILKIKFLQSAFQPGYFQLFEKESNTCRLKASEKLELGMPANKERIQRIANVSVVFNISRFVS